MDTQTILPNFYNLFPKIHHQIPSNQTHWGSLLQNLLNQIQTSDQMSNILSHSFWKHLFSKFQKFHFSHDQKMEFIQLVSKLIKVNFGHENVIDQIQFCGESGAKFHKLQNCLHFKHQQSFQYFKFMAIKIFHNNFQNEFCFTDLKFDLSIHEIQKVAQKVKLFCSNDMNAFAFLSLYFQISVKNRLSRDSLEKVEEEYINQLDYLAKKYPPNTFAVYFENQEIKLQKFPVNRMLETYFFENNSMNHFDELKNLIIKKAEDAKKDQHTFEHLVKDICYSKGYGFKSGVKIKSPDNNMSILRTIEKLVEDLLDNRQNFVCEQGQNSLTDHRHHGSYSVEDLKKYIEQQKQNSFLKIKNLLEEQRSIVFDSKDLVRGKCTFSTIEDIVETVKNLLEHIKKEGHSVLQVKDRLNKHTKDAVIIIKLPNSIAELQLVVKLDSVANEFNHKIYQLKRSKLYSPIANLFIHTQIWSETFFTEIFQLFNQIHKLKSKFDFQQNLEFRDFKYDLDDFKSKFLDPFAINYRQNSKSLQEQSHQVQEKINFLIEIIKKNQYNNINKAKRIELQKTCEVKFYKDNIDYEKGLQLLFCVKADIQQPNTQLMKLKGDIMSEKGLLEKALDCYFQCVGMYEKGQKTENESLIYATVLNQIGLVYYDKGNYSESLEYFEKCLQMKKKIKGEECSKDIATILNNIGGIYENKGNYSKALEQYFKCLSIKEKLYGKDSIQVATTLNNIGSVYDGRGNLIKALEFYERSLEIKIKVKGKDSIDVATTLNNIGSVYDSSGNFDKALQYYERCLNIKRKTKGPESIDVATSLNNIGVVCEHKGDYNLALQHYQKCLNIQIQIKGEKSIDVATTMNNIGLVYTNNGNFGSALQYFEKCLEIQKNIKGQDSIDVATTLNNIGFVNWKQGNLDKALLNYEASLQIEIKIKGPNSIDVATTLNNIGSVYHTKKDFNQAIQKYERCLRIHQEIGQKNSIDVAAILNNLGLVYNDCNDLNKALQSYGRCLAIKIKVKGQNSIDVATTLNNLSFLHQKMNSIEKAFDCARKSFEIRRHYLGPTHQYTKATQKQYQKMQKLLAKAI